MVHPLGYRVEDDNILAPLGWLKLSDDEQQQQAQQPDDASVSERSLSFTAIATDGTASCPTVVITNSPPTGRLAAFLLTQVASTPQYTAITTSVLTTCRAIVRR